MSKKHILVVDDDKRVLHYLQQGLKALGDEYQIDAVNSAVEAISYVQSTKPHLVISDFRMGDMDGLELLRMIRAQHTDTQLVMMTAYGTDSLQRSAQEIGIYRFVTKPFRTENLVNIARSALSTSETITISHDGMLIIPEQCLVEISDVLARLRTELRPELTLMADTSGHVVTHVGTTMGIDLNSIVALVAGNFATANELDRIFDRASFANNGQETPQDKPMHLVYLEGRNYDCYCANVGLNLFFTVIFSRQDTKNKAGMVWLYMRRTFHELQNIVLEHTQNPPTNVLDGNQETISEEYERLFGSNS